MHTIDTFTLYGICLRLIKAIPASRTEAVVLSRWIASRPDLFGPLPPIASAGRRRPGVDPVDWQALGDHIGTLLQLGAEPFDQQLDRLRIIMAHLGLEFNEQTILCFLVQQQRGGPIADLVTMLKREIGISDEAAIAWCCNLDDVEIWNALASKGPLITLGLVQSDSTLQVMRECCYTLSGLLLALLQPPLADGGPESAGLSKQ